eukprot:m.494983 g.494983  ORF g.494983 m.494983 type:complete len:208 (+) comp57295_c0_seq1:80-703(+)
MAPLRQYIDAHKGITLFVVLAIIAYFDAAENTTLWVYGGVHGGYGILWLLKSAIYPDRAWEEETSLWYGLVAWGSLAVHWVSPIIIAVNDVQQPPWFLALIVLLFAFGVFFHFVSDMQKHVALQFRKGLITDGLFAYCRNTNYFGELLIYVSFVLLSGPHWFPVFYLALFVGVVWVPNMIKKDKSLSRYPEFAAYKKRTTVFIPFVY